MSNISRIDISAVNNPGKISIDVYFAGCDIEPKCIGCHNSNLWDKEQGSSYNSVDLIMRITELINTLKTLLPSSKFISVCYLGGEPLAEYNRGLLAAVTCAIKLLGVEQIIFTGHTKKEIFSEDLASYIMYADFIKTGRYDKTKTHAGLLSTSNQKLLPVLYFTK